jgi:hypothetical protein
LYKQIRTIYTYIDRCVWSVNQQITSQNLTPVVRSEYLITGDQIQRQLTLGIVSKCDSFFQTSSECIYVSYCMLTVVIWWCLYCYLLIIYCNKLYKSFCFWWWNRNEKNSKAINLRDRLKMWHFFSNEVSFVWWVGGFQLSRLKKKQNRTLRFVSKSLKMHLKNGIKLNWLLSLVKTCLIHYSFILNLTTVLRSKNRKHYFFQFAKEDRCFSMRNNTIHR